MKKTAITALTASATAAAMLVALGGLNAWSMERAAADAKASAPVEAPVPDRIILTPNSSPDVRLEPGQAALLQWLPAGTALVSSDETVVKVSQKTGLHDGALSGVGEGSATVSVLFGGEIFPLFSVTVASAAE